MQAQLPVRTAPAVVTPRARLARLAVAFLAAVPAAFSPASAQTTCARSACGFLNTECGGTPAHPVPKELWPNGTLQPADSDACPTTSNPSAICVAAERDGTSF